MRICRQAGTKSRSAGTKADFAPEDQKSQFTTCHDLPGNQNSQITNNRPQDSDERSEAVPRSGSKTLRPQDFTIAKVVNGLSLRTPWKSTCLVKALAAHKMFSKRHIPHSVHFGMKKNESGKFEAHAWVSTGGRVVIGGENSGEYREVGRFEG